MEVLDDRGYLFGLINVVDLVVVLLLVAVLAAGAVVLTANQSGEVTQVIVFRTEPYPKYTVDAIQEGPVSTHNIVAVENKSMELITIDNKSTPQIDSSYIGQLRIRLVVEVTNDGLPVFESKRLVVGRQLTLDLGEAIVDGVVIDIVAPVQPNSSTR